MASDRRMSTCFRVRDGEEWRRQSLVVFIGVELCRAGFLREADFAIGVPHFA